MDGQIFAHLFRDKLSLPKGSSYKGDNNQNKTLWYSLDGSINSVYPFLVLSKRLMGCQFINAHNKPISDIFNFNTNIQIGDASQVFYSTLYTSKSTQEEDSKKQVQIGCAVIKKIKRLHKKNSIGSVKIIHGCFEKSKKRAWFWRRIE
jgi:hypothetical protein